MQVFHAVGKISQDVPYWEAGINSWDHNPDPPHMGERPSYFRQGYASQHLCLAEIWNWEPEPVSNPGLLV